MVLSGRPSPKRCRRAQSHVIFRASPGWTKKETRSWITKWLKYWRKRLCQSSGGGWGRAGVVKCRERGALKNRFPNRKSFWLSQSDDQKLGLHWCRNGGIIVFLCSRKCQVAIYLGRRCPALCPSFWCADVVPSRLPSSPLLSTLTIVSSYKTASSLSASYNYHPSYLYRLIYTLLSVYTSSFCWCCPTSPVSSHSSRTPIQSKKSTVALIVVLSDLLDSAFFDSSFFFFS